MFVLKMAHNNKITKQSSIANLNLKMDGDTNMQFDVITDFYFVYTVTLFLHYSKLSPKGHLYKMDTLLELTPPVGPSFFAPFSWLSIDGQIEPVPRASVLQRIDCTKLQICLEYYNSEDCSNHTKKLVTLFTVLWCSITSKSQKGERMLVNWN